MSDFAMSGMVCRYVDVQQGNECKFGAGLEPEAINRNGQLSRDLLQQQGQAQVDSKLMPANSFKAQIRLRQSSYQQVRWWKKTATTLETGVISHQLLPDLLEVLEDHNPGTMQLRTRVLKSMTDTIFEKTCGSLTVLDEEV